ncbi:CD209 antigen-like protein E [Sander lucioperca]|uniref:CD209 antigen-like protein E n=1 Tax=Sander lucioperca TaxID=283035 RepID=UPI00125E58B2|nr:CD209 antigen-like protein E [Sander lucioperca]
MQQMEVSDYGNESPRPKQKGSGDANQTERRLCQVLLLSFGLLCVIQAILNVSLRLTLYSTHSDCNATHFSSQDQLTNKIKNLEEERDRLRTNLETAQERWEYFNGSFYYISSIEKTWQESRDDCLQKGADLVIINSQEEQDFTTKFDKRLWIGLTDSETEGTWKWVDGTPLTKSYWDSGEPNDENGEDCVEIRYFDPENSWSDNNCLTQLNWICEMKVRP